MKVIVDVNVWISAILGDGVPEQILQLAGDKKIKIFASQPLLAELEATLNRPDPDLAYELWNNAHTATLEDYGLKEGFGILFYPSIED